MRLIELAPQFLARKSSGNLDMPHVLVHVDTLAEADSIRFLCPKCWDKNDGAEGTHQIHIPFAGRKLGANGWKVAGSTYSDLTLTPSIALPAGFDGCGFHGYVTNGQVVSV